MTLAPVRSGDVIDDRFEIQEHVGAGAVGAIYQAFDRTSGAKVALKMVHGGEFTTRFTSEARVIASLSHPAVIRYVAHGALPSGEMYLAMEWLEGEDLAQRLQRAEVTTSEAVVLAARVADGLAAAHAIGIVHRDVKPGNIFLPQGDVALAKIIDFGIARLASGTQVATQSGVIIGTPGYMAPEQAKGLAGLDARADVFALGCVLYRCLSGYAPFTGEDMLAVLAKVVLEEPTSLSKQGVDLPDALSDLVARMMAKEPADRPSDGAAVARALAEIDFRPSQAPPMHKRPVSEAALTADGEPGAAAVNLRQSSIPPPLGGEALTLNEQRLVSVVLAGAGGAQEARSLAAPEIERCGGRLNVLADGSMVVTIWGPGSAVDRAERAARCALAIQAHFADVPVAVVTGRGVVSARVIEGEVIDRGVRAVRSLSAGAVRIDTGTAGMLGPRFMTEPDRGGLILHGERHLRETALLLLGRPTPCVGRGRELSVLEGVFTSSVEEPEAGAVLVTGPAGDGKSRLRREFIEKLRRRRGAVEILIGRADSLGESSPFGPIADAIRETAGIWGAESIESRRQKLVQRLRRHLDGERLVRVAAFLGELIRAPFPDEEDEALRAARESAQLMGDAMRAAWEDWLTAECNAQPVVLIIEDLHWADAATVQMIDATLRNLRDQPLMVLVLARPEVHTKFPGLWAEHEVQVIKLGALSRKASEQLVRGALGSDADANVVARIVDRADGNPFYLEELIRAVAAGRGDAFPDSVLGTVEARLDAEGAEAKRILRAASVFGARFTTRGVAALLGGCQHEDEVGARLCELVSREIIAPAGDRDSSDDAGYVFRHSLVREAAYATLTVADRTLGHRLAGLWLEQIGYPDAMTLAEHFLRGEEPARAAHWYRSAAEEALEANDLEAVLDRAQRGVACGASGEDLGVLRLVEAEAYLWRGELASAEERGTQAVELLDEGAADWFRAVYQVVIAAGKLGAFDRVEGWAARATTQSPARGARSARIICLAKSVTYLSFGGRYAAADTLLDVIEAAEELDAQAIALIREGRSIRASTAGDPAGCLEGMRAALAAFEQAGDQRNACMTRANMGFLYAELGDFEGAEGALRAALATADRMGLHDLSAFALHNLGLVLAFRGHLEEGRRLEEQAANAFQKHGDPRLEGLARTYVAKIDAMAGNFAAAGSEACAAAEALLAAPPLRAGALAVLARVRIAEGRAEDALAAATEASALLQVLGTIEEGEAMVRLAYAEALDANGRNGEFIEAITAARDALLARAAKISDPAWRERFLSGVPDNEKTLALFTRVTRAASSRAPSLS